MGIRLLAVAVAGCFVLGPAAHAAGTRTLVGEYVYYVGNIGPDDNVGAIEAVFRPTGDAAWDVSFQFVFRGQDMVYTGTAEGSLSEGALSGTVEDDRQNRTFRFSGTFTGGRFEGTHAEIKDGKEYDTGTLTLAE